MQRSAVPDAALHLEAIHALVVRAWADLLGGGFDADLAPVGGDHLAVFAGRFTHADAGVFDHVAQPLPIGSQAEAFAVPLVQANLSSSSLARSGSYCAQASP